MTTWTDEARRRLGLSGQRVGAARARVIAYLDEQDCCVTAQDIHEALASRGVRIGLASVYRAVDTLVECGAAHRVELGDGTARYEAAREGHGHHHHLVCDDCGRLEPFHDPALERAIAAVEHGTGYVVSTHEVVLHGACRECLAG